MNDPIGRLSDGGISGRILGGLGTGYGSAGLRATDEEARSRSGNSGAKTERRARVVHRGCIARLSPSPFGIGTKAKIPAGRSPASYERKKPGDGLSVVAHSKGREPHFTLNQYKTVVCVGSSPCK